MKVSLVVVRRRSDGLYYNGARANMGLRSGNWVHSMQDVLPYTNESGARKAMTGYVAQPQCDCPNQNPRKKHCRHARQRREEMRRRFDERYEIIYVQLQAV